MTSETSSGSAVWERIASEALAGHGLAAPSKEEDAIEVPGFLELLSTDLPPETMLEVYRGDIWIAIFEQAEGGKARSDFFPGDQFVRVLEGTVTLTERTSGSAQTFSRGDRFFIPKGWEGIWHSSSFYRELVVYSREVLLPYTRVFQAGIVDPVRSTLVVAIDVEGAARQLREAQAANNAAPQRVHLLGSDLLVRVVVADDLATLVVEHPGGVLIEVLEGDITFLDGIDAREGFTAGDWIVAGGTSGLGCKSFGDGFALVISDGRQS